MLIDDELAGLEIMERLLAPYHHEFHICAKCLSVKDAKEKLLHSKPDLLFLDINMPSPNGFELVNDLERCGVAIPFVFITAYSEYMKDAFKVRPFDYLLKPVDRGELSDLLLRFKYLQDKKSKNTEIVPKGVLTDKGIEFINPEDIVYIQKENGKSVIYFFNGNYTLSTKSLKDILDIYQTATFIQIHKSTIVNCKYISCFCNPSLYINFDKNTVCLSIGRAYIKKVKETLFIDD